MRDGWIIKQLDEVCTKFGAGPFGSNMKVSTFVDDGIPVVSGNHMTELELVEETFNYITVEHANRMQSSIVQRNDVVITKAGTIGQVSLIPENSRFSKYVLSSRQLFARPNVEYVIPKYLAIYLKYGRGQDQILSNVNRTGVPSLSQAVSFIRNVRIELPPLPEQKRIVDLISSVDSYIESLQQQLESAKRSRNAVLHELLTAGGDDWLSEIVGDISELRYGFTESANWDPVGPKFLRITDIQDGSVDWDSVPYCRISDSEKEAQLLEDGDLVFARTGATTGKSFLVTNPPISVCASYLIRLRPNQSKVNPHYLSIFFQSEDYWRQIMAGTSGSAQGGVNASKLSKLKIDIPPLSTQKEISGIIQELDKYSFGIQKTIYKSQELRSGLLSDLLSGNHEIPSTYDKVMGAA